MTLEKDHRLFPTFWTAFQAEIVYRNAAVSSDNHHFTLTNRPGRHAPLGLSKPRGLCRAGLLTNERAQKRQFLCRGVEGRRLDCDLWPTHRWQILPNVDQPIPGPRSEMVKTGIFLTVSPNAEVLFNHHAIKGARSSKRFSLPEDPWGRVRQTASAARWLLATCAFVHRLPGLQVILLEIFCSHSRSRSKVVLAKASRFAPSAIRCAAREGGRAGYDRQHLSPS